MRSGAMYLGVAMRPPAHVLHDHEGVGTVLALIEDRDDVRMRDARGAPRLVGEALAERRVGLRPEELHGDVAREPLVPRAPDLARAALVDALDEPVAVGEEAALLARRRGAGHDSVRRSASASS